MSAVLLRIQLRIGAMMPGNVSAAFASDLPGKIHSLKSFSSLGGGLRASPPDALPPTHWEAKL